MDYCLFHALNTPWPRRPRRRTPPSASTPPPRRRQLRRGFRWRRSPAAPAGSIAAVAGTKE